MGEIHGRDARARFTGECYSLPGFGSDRIHLEGVKGEEISVWHVQTHVHLI